MGEALRAEQVSQMADGGGTESGAGAQGRRTPLDLIAQSWETMKDKAAAEYIAEANENIPLMLLKEGKAQVINVDHKKMLADIMTLLGARSPPLFSESDCGEEGVKISIRLDLSFGETSIIQDVAGETLLTKDAAETNAVMMALEHLGKNCHIEVSNFRSNKMPEERRSIISTYLQEQGRCLKLY